MISITLKVPYNMRIQDRFGPACASIQPYHNFPYLHEHDEQFTDPVELVKTSLYADAQADFTVCSRSLFTWNQFD